MLYGVFLVEIFSCVSVANIFDDFPYARFVACYFSLVHHFAKVGTKNSTEIMVSRVGKEGTAVGEHSDERA